MKSQPLTKLHQALQDLVLNTTSLWAAPGVLGHVSIAPIAGLHLLPLVRRLLTSSQPHLTSPVPHLTQVLARALPPFLTPLIKNIPLCPFLFITLHYSISLVVLTL